MIYFVLEYKKRGKTSRTCHVVCCLITIVEGMQFLTIKFKGNIIKMLAGLMQQNMCNHSNLPLLRALMLAWLYIYNQINRV